MSLGSDPRFVEMNERMCGGLRKAGLPDEPTPALAHLERAASLKFDNQRSALAEIEAALADDPNNARAYSEAGEIKMYLGQGEEGVTDVETALRLSSNDKEAPTWLSHLCWLHTKLAHWEQGIEWCEKAIAAGAPQKSWVLGQLAGAYAWAGREKEAKEVVARLHDVDPNFTVQTYLTNAEHLGGSATYQAQAARAAEGMRKAGVPEE
jgi:tetratricopeptide (TPR) repeat protein